MKRVKFVYEQLIMGTTLVNYFILSLDLLPYFEVVNRIDENDQNLFICATTSESADL